MFPSWGKEKIGVLPRGSVLRPRSGLWEDHLLADQKGRGVEADTLSVTLFPSDKAIYGQGCGIEVE